MSTDMMVQMLNISKRFGGVKALENVSIEVARGEIHALMGENGAGKSTLMKILAGAYRKDEGTIVIDGEPIEPHSPRDVLARGVSVIYQEFMLAPDLTVAENLFIDRLSEGIFINWADLNRRASEQLERLGFGHIPATTKVGSLSVGYQQVVEICKSLARDAKVLVFDEPTAVLTHAETDTLLDLIRRLKDQQVTIVYISHRLNEIFAITDRITVLKDGRYVDTVRTGQTSEEELVSLMVGRQIEHLFPPRDATVGAELLRVQRLNAGKRVRNVSFAVNRGEILGFSGLVGSGRTETMRAIFGLDKRDSGQIWWRQEPISPRSPAQAIRLGMGLLPEDRKTQGLVLAQSIRVNTTLVSQSGNGLIPARRERAMVAELLGKISTRYGSVDDPVNSLSGGNQQKVSLAKWLAVDTELMILDEPTRGVDVGAKVEIYRLIGELAASGVAIIMISSEMMEIIGVCDRAVVMREGEIVGELARDQLTENNLIRLSMGV